MECLRIFIRLEARELENPYLKGSQKSHDICLNKNE